MFQGVFAFKYTIKIRSKLGNLTKSAPNTVLRLWIRLTKSVTYSYDTYGKGKLTWFEEIFEEYKKYWSIKVKYLDLF